MATADPRQRHRRSSPPSAPGAGGHTFTSLTDTVCQIVRAAPAPGVVDRLRLLWTLTGVLLAMLGYLFVTGVGVWGLNQPVGWACDITNFVFWVGIGHAGTLISAILFLFRQKWRTASTASPRR